MCEWGWRAVRQMMAAPGALGLGMGMPMNTEQKKKLLWGKKVEPAVAVRSSSSSQVVRMHLRLAVLGG